MELRPEIWDLHSPIQRMQVSLREKQDVKAAATERLFPKISSYSPNLCSMFRRMLPLSFIDIAKGASIPSTAPAIDPLNPSSGGPSAGDIISAVSVAVVGTVIWHCVKESPNRRPYLIISLLVSGWIYSMVLNHNSGLWPISR